MLVLGGNISNSNVTQTYYYFSFERAYADGLTQENLPPASLGDRDGSLFVKISPPVYTTESKENAFMQFRLFDAKTNETINFVTYDITVRKGANPSSDELGGKIKVPKSPIPNMGYFAVCSDTANNTFGVVESTAKV